MKIPNEIIAALEDAANGEYFARINLEMSIHDGKARYRITKETSYIPGKSTSGVNNTPPG